MGCIHSNKYKKVSFYMLSKYRFGPTAARPKVAALFFSANINLFCPLGSK